MKQRGIDWARVAQILGARDPEAMLRCPKCRDEGTVPYVAEHVLTAHPASQEARRLAKLVAGGSPRRSA